MAPLTIVVLAPATLVKAAPLMLSRNPSSLLTPKVQVPGVEMWILPLASVT
jgi:hypothetical protein